MTYKPRPLETSQVELAPDLVALTEKLAKNTHDQWAKGRIADGWQYGSKRDEIKKTTPSLVPYDQLPNSEQDYDRVTAMETLKALVVMGYEIVKK